VSRARIAPQHAGLDRTASPYGRRSSAEPCARALSLRTEASAAHSRTWNRWVLPAVDALSDEERLPLR
jgi:hypothetical protein